MNWLGWMILIGVVPLVYFAVRRAFRERFEQYKSAAAILGLEIKARPLMLKLELMGTVSGFAVHVGPGDPAKRDRPGPAYTVFLANEIPFELKRSRYNLSKEVELGDPEFDRTFHITGREDVIFAALSRSVRRALLSSNEASLVGTELKCFGSLADPPDRTIVSDLKRLVKLAEQMRVGPDDLDAKLLAAFEEETIPATEHKQLRLLLRATTDPGIRESAIKVALDKEDTELRLTAALNGGDRGVTTLRRFAADEDAPDETRARALERLGNNAFSSSLLLLWRAKAGAKMRAAIALRLRDVPEEKGVEAALLEALRDDEDEVKIAAMSALSVRGTIAAVEPLHEYAQGLLRSTALKEAARAAVQAIQERIRGGERGGLSLADSGDQGALSIAGESGALSKT